MHAECCESADVTARLTWGIVQYGSTGFQEIEDEKGEGIICIVPKAKASGICGTRTSKCYSSSEEQLSIMKNNYCALNVSPFMQLKSQEISGYVTVMLTPFG